MPEDKDSRPLGLCEVGSYQKPAQKKSHACVPLREANRLMPLLSQSIPHERQPTPKQYSILDSLKIKNKL